MGPAGAWCPCRFTALDRDHRTTDGDAAAGRRPVPRHTPSAALADDDRAEPSTPVCDGRSARPPVRRASTAALPRKCPARCALVERAQHPAIEPAPTAPEVQAVGKDDDVRCNRSPPMCEHSHSPPPTSNRAGRISGRPRFAQHWSWRPLGRRAPGGRRVGPPPAPPTSCRAPRQLHHGVVAIEIAGPEHGASPGRRAATVNRRTPASSARAGCVRRRPDAAG